MVSKQLICFALYKEMVEVLAWRITVNHGESKGNCDVYMNIT